MNMVFRVSMSKCFKIFGIGLFIFLCSSSFAQKKVVPELWGQCVHDDAHVLQQGTVDQLEKDLKSYEDSTSNQIAILIIQSLDGDVLEEFSIRVVEKWKLGQKGKDNGVLLLIAVDDHKMRIEVGKGLQGVLTDALSSRIIRNEMAPAFRRGDYDAGVNAAITAITKAIGGEYTSSDIDTSSLNQLSGGEKIGFGLFIFGILGLFTFFAVFVGGGIGWGMYAFLIPFWALFPWIVIGVQAGMVLLVIYIIALPILKLVIPRSQWGKSFMKKLTSGSGRRSSGSSWGSGWSSSGSSWSSSDSGSSFSGGGGSFDGGGSSGSW